LAVGFGHDCGAAFLAADRDLDIGIDQPVEHGQVAFPRHAEHMVGAVQAQLIDQHMPGHAGSRTGGNARRHAGPAGPGALMESVAGIVKRIQAGFLYDSASSCKAQRTTASTMAYPPSDIYRLVSASG